MTEFIWWGGPPGPHGTPSSRYCCDGISLSHNGSRATRGAGAPSWPGLGGSPHQMIRLSDFRREFRPMLRGVRQGAPESIMMRADAFPCNRSLARQGASAVAAQKEVAYRNVASFRAVAATECSA
jgi:hypothetical protein